ncbi:hypothetical protein TRVL_08693 [Trypanosoma vivax]|nr:hypothetical protein TRVL_08693 [Trypanosoma vivax]
MRDALQVVAQLGISATAPGKCMMPPAVRATPASLLHLLARGPFVYLCGSFYRSTAHFQTTHPPLSSACFSPQNRAPHHGSRKTQNPNLLVRSSPAVDAKVETAHFSPQRVSTTDGAARGRRCPSSLRHASSTAGRTFFAAQNPHPHPTPAINKALPRQGCIGVGKKVGSQCALQVAGALRPVLAGEHGCNVAGASRRP